MRCWRSCGTCYSMIGSRRGSIRLGCIIGTGSWIVPLVRWLMLGCSFRDSDDCEWLILLILRSSMALFSGRLFAEKLGLEFIFGIAEELFCCCNMIWRRLLSFCG